MGSSGLPNSGGRDSIQSQDCGQGRRDPQGKRSGLILKIITEISFLFSIKIRHRVNILTLFVNFPMQLLYTLYFDFFPTPTPSGELPEEFDKKKSVP